MNDDADAADADSVPPDPMTSRLEVTIAAALRACHFENFDRAYGLSKVVATALRFLPVEQRMEAMGMVRQGHEYRPRGSETDRDAEANEWWRCATCGGYDTNASHRPTYEPADYVPHYLRGGADA